MPSLITAETLFSENKDIVYRYAYSVLWNKEDAEDITSQTFLTALKKLDQAQKYPKHSTWLIAIARNHIGNLWQKKQLAPLPENPGEDEQHWDDLTPDTTHKSHLEELVKNEDCQRVLKALGQLSPIEREIVTLKLWDEWKHSEIAEIVHLAEPTVKIYYRRAIHKLYEILKPKDKHSWAIYFLALGQMKEYGQFKAASSMELPTNITGNAMFKTTISKVVMTMVITGVAVLVIGVGAGYMLFSEPQTVKQPTITPTPTELVTEVPTSTPTISTPTPAPSISANWETKNYTLDNRFLAGWQMKFTFKVPKGTTFTQVKSSVVPELIVAGSGYELRINSPYEDYPYHFTQTTKIGSSSFGTLYRVQRNSQSVLPTRYTNTITQTGTCQGMEGPIQSPCGLGIVSMQKNVYFIAYCSKQNDKYITCDEIMRLLKAQKI